MDYYEQYINMLDTKVALIDNLVVTKELLDDDELDRSRSHIAIYNTIEKLESELIQLKSINFKLIVDVSKLYDYSDLNNPKRIVLDLKHFFPNSKIIRPKIEEKNKKIVKIYS